MDDFIPRFEVLAVTCEAIVGNFVMEIGGVEYSGESWNIPHEWDIHQNFLDFHGNPIA